MSSISTFYLSRLIGEKVSFVDGTAEGKLVDLIVDVNSARPRVIGIAAKVEQNIELLDFEGMRIKSDDVSYTLQCEHREQISPSAENTMYLAEHILDKRIVDIDGRKLVKVKDIRLARLADGMFAVAADVGLEGFLRRAGLAKPAKKIFKFFGKGVPGKLILWDDLEIVNDSDSGVKLSKAYSKLSTLHPSDIADILEDMDKKTQFAVFSSLDEERAADVLEELETEVQLQVIEGMTLEKAADVLEKMPSDEVADILDEMQEDKAEELLNEMEEDTSEEVRELMDYPENSIGSIMSTDYIAFNENMSVDDTLLMLRKLKPEPQSVYYLYIIDDMERLVATVSIRDLVISEPQTKLKEIMNNTVIYVYTSDRTNILTDIVSKYSLLAVPVVEKDEVLAGIVPVDDIVYNVLKNRRRM